MFCIVANSLCDCFRQHINAFFVYILASEAKSYLLQFQENDCDYNQKDLEFMLYSTILDQYRIYGMIEPMLQYPSTLLSQNIYQISFDSQEKLISE